MNMMKSCYQLTLTILISNWTWKIE